MVMAPFLIWRWSAVKVLSMLLLLGAGGGAAAAGLFSRTRVSLGVSTTRLMRWSCWPFQVAWASMASMVLLTPEVESTKPAASGSMCLASRWTPKGVREASCGLMGPALPLSETVASPGRWAEALKGKDFWNEK